MTSPRLIGYVRCAPRERRSTRPELAEQRDLVAAECERRDARLVRVEEDVRSGRTLRRPGLDAALAACRSGEADGIVVARLDRLTHSLEDLALLMRGALEGGFTIVAPDVGVDLSTDAGQRLATVLAAASHWRPRSLTRRAGRALREHGESPVGRGRPSSTPPELAERIRSLRRRGSTLQAICDTLNAEGVAAPRGGSHWRPSSLRAILRPLTSPSREVQQ